VPLGEYRLAGIVYIYTEAEEKLLILPLRHIGVIPSIHAFKRLLLKEKKE
jgi:hypothetical protein